MCTPNSHVVGSDPHSKLTITPPNQPTPPFPPPQATAAKVARHYTGPTDPEQSELAGYMTEANPRGPLVLCVAKLFSRSDGSAFDAYGRVISGTLRPGGCLPPSTCHAL